MCTAVKVIWLSLSTTATAETMRDASCMVLSPHDGCCMFFFQCF